MLRHSARCISNGAAICQVKVVVQPCSSTVLRCSRAALLLDNGGSSVVAFGNTVKRRGLVSFRSFSSTVRESTCPAEEEADDPSTETTTDEQQPPQEQGFLTQDASSSSLSDETRDILRHVLQKSGKSVTALRQAAEIKIEPFTKPGSELQPDPKNDWPLNETLRHHIRTCLSNIQYESREMGVRDTGLSVCTLGTGAGTGSRVRFNTATVVKNMGDGYLVDAGEGVSRQFQLSRVDFTSIRKIFSESICVFSPFTCVHSGLFVGLGAAGVLHFLCFVKCVSWSNRVADIPWIPSLCLFQSYAHAWRPRLWITRSIIELSALSCKLGCKPNA